MDKIITIIKHKETCEITLHHGVFLSADKDREVIGYLSLMDVITAINQPAVWASTGTTPIKLG